MIFGADISTLPEITAGGGRFYAEDDKGQLQEVDLLEQLILRGVSSVRVRLWMDPYDENGEPYAGGTADLDRYKMIARRCRDKKIGVMLDLHYSDFWCDPSRQMIPKAWRGLSLEETCTAVYEYTKNILSELKAEDLEPQMVQVGNEITNGMLWPLAGLMPQEEKKDTVTGFIPRTGYDALAKVISSGTRAVREVSSAKIILHLENSSQGQLWQEWLDNIVSRGADFDYIGASYYPYWHGSLASFKANMDHCIERYDKDILVVETAYGFTSEPFKSETGESVNVICDPCKRFDGTDLEFPLTREGQAGFICALMDTIASMKDGRGLGFWWWEPGWVPQGKVSWASEASLRYCHEEGKRLGNEWANQCLFDYEGKELPALKAISEKLSEKP